MRPLEPLPSQRPAPPAPSVARPPAVGRTCPAPATSGRQPQGSASPAPLQAAFRFDARTRQIVVALIRPETSEVVRQIPPERILNLSAHLRRISERAFDRNA